MVFAIGGLIPLIRQDGILPLFLAAATAVEICFELGNSLVILLQISGIIYGVTQRRRRISIRT